MDRSVQLPMQKREEEISVVNPATLISPLVALLGTVPMICHENCAGYIWIH